MSSTTVATLNPPAEATTNRYLRALHDEVSQSLFAAQLLAGTLSRSQRLADTDRAQASALERLHRGAIAKLQLMRWEFEPQALLQVPLAQALQQATDVLAAREVFSVHTALDRSLNPPSAQRQAAYRIALEALANVARHSRASQVELGWAALPSGGARLRVADNGCGFDRGQRGVGLARIQDEAAAVGGRVTLKTAPAAGTELLFDIQWS